MSELTSFVTLKDLLFERYNETDQKATRDFVCVCVGGGGGGGGQFIGMKGDSSLSNGEITRKLPIFKNCVRNTLCSKYKTGGTKSHSRSW